MATLTAKEIEELQLQLEQKQKELQAIYDKLAEAGVIPLADDFLDCVAGGGRQTVRPLPPSPVPSGAIGTLHTHTQKPTGTLIPFDFKK